MAGSDLYQYLETLIWGFIGGILVAAPIGAVGVLCIQRTIAVNRLHGFVSGLGAAVADAFYACVAAFGLTFIDDFISCNQVCIRLVGGIALLVIGVKNYLKEPHPRRAAAAGTTYVSGFTSALFLTMTNPLTLIAFAAIFATMNLATDVDRDHVHGSILVLGVLGGSAFWWFILSGMAQRFRRLARGDGMKWVHKTAGAIVFLSGVLVLLSILRKV